MGINLKKSDEYVSLYDQLWRSCIVHEMQPTPMRRFLLLLLFFVFAFLMAGAQPAVVNVNVYLDASLIPQVNLLEGYKVSVEDSSYTTGLHKFDLFSSSMSRVDTTYTTSGGEGEFKLYIADCNGNRVLQRALSYDTTPGVNNQYIIDTIALPCINNCEGNGVKNSLGGNTYSFDWVNHPTWQGSSAVWQFSDGTVLNGYSVSKTFAYPGSYTYYLYNHGCRVDSGAVTTTNQQGHCFAGFIVDTVNSFNHRLIVWNVSIVSPSRDSLDFMWFFGDGDSALAYFPNHVYENPGRYELKVRMREYNAMYQITCESFHTDSIGMDAQGNVDYKAGFTLNVMDPSKIGLTEISGGVSLYPQPATNFVRIEAQTVIRELLVSDSMGRTVERAIPNSKEYNLRLDSYPVGVYLIQVHTSTGVIVEKCIVH